MISKGFVLALIGILAINVYGQPFRKVIHNTDPDAKCLDGSSPMIYLHEGGDTKNIIIYMIGGGACMGTDLASTLESCYKRSKGQFGTSTVWPDTYPAGAGFLSTDPATSKFANWTKIVIMYCDGAFHQGNNKGPIQYKDRLLYFRGAVNTRSHIKYADQKYGLNNAERIIVSGSSAGGIATYLWVDYVKSLVSKPEKVFGVADSGIFYDPLVNFYMGENFSKENIANIFEYYESSEAQRKQLKVNDDPNPIQILMSLSNVDERPPNKACSDLLTAEQQWKCIFIQFSYPTLPSKLLFVESSYDQFVIEALQIHCLTKGASGYSLKNCSNLQLDVIEIYRDYYLEKFLPKLLKYGHSIWTISCSWHAEMISDEVYDSPLQMVPKDTGRTMRSAVESFVFEGKRIEAIDLFAWPANTPCAY